MGQNVIKGRKRGTKPKFDYAYLRKAAETYLIEELTYREISERYGISKNIISRFVQQHSDEILQTNVIGMRNLNDPEASPASQQMSNETELLHALERANKKINALELLLQVAEEELGISIRKKFGTRQ